MPPGWTTVTPTGWPAIRISSRSASVKPRTAYFAALYIDWPGIEIEPEQRRHVHQVAVAGGDQVGQELLGAVDDAPEVDADDPVHVGVLEVLDVAGQRDAGVVDDDVDAAELLGDRVGVRRERGAVGDVEPVAAHLARAGGLDQVDGLGQPGLVDVGDRDQRAAPGDARRRARGRCRTPAPVITTTLSVEGLHGSDDRFAVGSRVRSQHVVRLGVEAGEHASQGERRASARGRCCGRGCRGTTTSSRRCSTRSASSAAGGRRSTAAARPRAARPRRIPDRAWCGAASRR